MHCPLCSLSGVSYDELSHHINSAHIESPSSGLSVKASVPQHGTAWTEDREESQTVTMEDGHFAESLPPGAPSCEMPMPVAESGKDNAVGSVCGTNSVAHSPEERAFTKNSKDRQESLEMHVAMKQKRLSSPLKGTKDDDDDDYDASSC